MSESVGIVVGTAGHVDHGKSAIVQALTGIDPDRLVEEKARGLTIELGFARLPDTPGVEIGMVDVPGHEDFIRNMLAGATGVDLLLLVVAADEGPMPQTREHLAIARLLGIRDGIVALTKVDRVDGDWVDLVSGLTRDELASTGIGEDWSIVPVSTRTGAGIEELRAGILGRAAGVRRRNEADLFRLPVDRAFTVRGTGTVVTGSVWSGTVRTGDAVRLVPPGTAARVRGIQVHGEERRQVGPGTRCALSLGGIAHTDAHRGQTVVTADAWEPVRRFGGRIELLSGAGVLEHGDGVRLHQGTTATPARVRLETRRRIEPGETAWAVLACETPVLVRARDRFVLRAGSPLRTIGGGVIAEPDPPRRWRERVPSWEELLSAERTEAVRAAVRLARGRGVLPARLPVLTGLPLGPDDNGDRAEKIGGRLFSADARAELRAEILACLARSHREAPRSRGMSLESVRAALGIRYAAALIDHELEALERIGETVRNGPEIRLRTHEIRLTKNESEALERVHRAIADAGLAPPAPPRLAEDARVDRPLLNDILRILVDEQKVVAVTPELYLSCESERELRSVAADIVGRAAPASPAAFAEALGLSRRELIPLLEYLDRVGVTRRTDAGRRAGHVIIPAPGPDSQSR